MLNIFVGFEQSNKYSISASHQENHFTLDGFIPIKVTNPEKLLDSL